MLVFAPRERHFATFKCDVLYVAVSQSLWLDGSVIGRDRNEYGVVLMPPVAISSIISIGISLFVVGCAYAIARWAQKTDKSDMRSGYRNRFPVK